MYHQKLLSYKKWREWWIERLSSRYNRLYDIEKGRKMDMEKRIKVERPKMNDFIDFFITYGTECYIGFGKDQLFVEIRSMVYKGVRIKKYGNTSIEATKLALTDFLKELHHKESRWV